MSQLINATSLGNVIIVTGSFIVLLILIRLFAWDRITGIFEERAKKIADDIDSAEAARQKAEDLADKRQVELANSRQEAGQIIENARATAESQKSETLAKTKEEVLRMKDKAKLEIEQSRQEALETVKDEVADLSFAVASKLLGANLDQAAQSELIDQYIKKIGEA
ncbi:F0F1 ATP synthase subunit B [Streptococcus sp. DD13]|uniref:F0F1 ATP synthase subunit B n=1 Tax=Streptococcus sp. DD13 TaxID=1777881 RepID=UPI000792BFAD|nr:F0F1 ATP synthase subunit B [Streptococcus sp. DD13]KXT79192.1 ATP synthase B chain [Streptococcus sp. DD13]